MSFTITAASESVTFGGEVVTFDGEAVTYTAGGEHAAVTRGVDGQYDRRMFRPPFGTAWRQAGDGRLLPETVRVTIEVETPADVDNLIHLAESAETLEAVFWRGTAEGLVNAVTAPRGTWFAVTLEWLMASEPSFSVLSWQTWGDSITFSELSGRTFGEFE